MFSRHNKKTRRERQESELKKLRLAWEGIRHREDYRCLYDKYHKKTRGKRKVICSDLIGKFCMRQFVDYKIKASKLSYEFLKILFNSSTIVINPSDWGKLLEPEKQYLDINVLINIEAPVSRIAKDLETQLKDTIELRKKHKTEAKSKSSVKKERVRLFDYNLTDFEIYRKVKQIRKKRRNVSFQDIVRMTDLEKDDDAHDVDRKANAMENAYDKAEWIIKGGFRDLVS